MKKLNKMIQIHHLLIVNLQVNQNQAKLVIKVKKVMKIQLEKEVKIVINLEIVIVKINLLL